MRATSSLTSLMGSLLGDEIPNRPPIKSLSGLWQRRAGPRRRCQDVRFGERAVPRRPTLAASAEADALIGVVQVRVALGVFSRKPDGIDQQTGRGRFAREGGDWH